MRFLRCRTQDSITPQYGQLIDNDVELLAQPPFEQIRPTGKRVPLQQVKLLAPAQPSKIIGVGRNYVAHAKEHQCSVPEQPLLFLKPPSTVNDPQSPIPLTPLSDQVEHEGELAVVIGAPAKCVGEADAMRYVFGYTAANDVKARDLQRADHQWTRGKGFDGFCPLGPWIETELDLESTAVSCHVNGEQRQHGSPTEMVFPIPFLIAYISAVMTLKPGDVILTGTPAGVSALHAGDVVDVEIDGICVLENPVR